MMTLAVSNRPLACASAAPVASAETVTAKRPRTVASIATFPKAKLPAAVEDFGRSCAKLLWATFPARSQNAVCEAASLSLGVSPDTIARILNGDTKHPDPRVMFACLAIYQSKTGKAWPIGGGFEIRITQTGRGDHG
jgi:hypothetical protein